MTNRHGQWKSDLVVEGYIANSEPLRKEREECLLPANLVLQEPDSIKGAENNGFKELQGFSQLYDDELDLQNDNVQPDLPMSQPDAETENDDALMVTTATEVGTLDDQCKKASNQKIAAMDVFGD